MRAALQRAWLRRGPLAGLLWPISLLFALAAAGRRALYRSGLLRTHRAGVPVIVVGNVVVGGAGKTPVLIALVQHLKARGLRVGVISRGHGRSSRGCLEVGPDSTAAMAGDEPLLVARRCRVPVFVAERRAEAARALLQAHPQVQVIVSDDGLQHLALARDIEVCVFDDRGTGNGWLLPAGPLREHWPRRVDFVLRTPAAPLDHGFVLQRRLAADAVRADGTTAGLSQWAGRECDALAGIAQPEAFFAMLRSRGLRLRSTHALPDHFDFTRDRRWASPDAPLLCTEKDAVKLWLVEPQAWAVPLEVEIDAAFWAALDARLSSLHGSPAA